MPPPTHRWRWLQLGAAGLILTHPGAERRDHTVVLAPAGQLHRIEKGNVEPGAMAVTLRLKLSQVQVDMLVEASVPDYLLANVRENQPQLMFDIPPAQQYGLVESLLLAARRLGLRGMQDMTNYICAGLIYGDRMQTDPAILAVLQQVKTREFTLTEAMGKFEIMRRRMMAMQTRRRIFLQLGAAGFVYPTVTQARGFFSAKKEIVVNVLVFNYLNRPIFDVYLNGAMVGASASLSGSPYGQFGTVAGVTVRNGPQRLTWRLDGPEGTPHNGDTVIAANAINVSVADLPKYTETLGVHIYPDYTAELIFTNGPVEQSPRGLTYAKKYHKDGK